MKNAVAIDSLKDPVSARPKTSPPPPLPLDVELDVDEDDDSPGLDSLDVGWGVLVGVAFGVMLGNSIPPLPPPKVGDATNTSVDVKSSPGFSEGFIVGVDIGRVVGVSI